MKMEMKKIILALSLIILSSCNGRISEGGAIQLDPSGPAPAGNPTPLRTEEITFKIVQSQVLNQSCVMCHSSAGGNKGGVNLETYQNIFSKKDLVRNEVVTNGMPLPPVHPLTRAQSDLIVRWIDAGAHESIGSAVPVELPVPVEPSQPATEVPVVAVTPDPVPVAINFESVMQKVITPKCLKCHSAGSGLVDLTSYEKVFALRGQVKIEIETNAMPMGDSLQPEQKKLILDWITAGAKNI